MFALFSVSTILSYGAELKEFSMSGDTMAPNFRFLKAFYFIFFWGFYYFAWGIYR